MPFLAPAIGAIVGAVGSAASFIGGLGIVGKAIVSLGLNAAIGAIQRKRAGKGQSTPGGVQFDRQYGSEVSRQVAFGVVGIAGHDTYVNTFGPSNNLLQQIYTLSDYPIDGLNRVAINGEWVTLGAVADPNKGFPVTSGDFANLIWIKTIDGRQTAADAYLISGANPSERWSAAHVGLGCAYVLVSMTYDRERNSNPPEFFFEFRGARLYDWRKDSTAGGVGSHRLNNPATHEFTENPIVMEYNYRIGLSINGDLFCGMAQLPIDLPLDKWTIAANICDEPKSDGAAYRCSIMVDCMATHGENIESMALACGAINIDSVNGSYPIVGSAQPIVATFTDDDIISNSKTTFRERRSMSELINSISGNFPNPDDLWSMVGYEPQISAAAIAVDRRTRDLPMDFPQVRSGRQAAQLASIYLKENRYEATGGVTLRPAFQGIECGDWIEWQSVRYGTRTFMVVDTGLMSLDNDGPRNISLSLQQRDASIYDGVSPPNIVIPFPNDRPQYLEEVQNLILTPVTVETDDGRKQPAIYFQFDAFTDDTVDDLLFEYWPTAQPSLVFTQRANGRLIGTLTRGIVAQTQYTVRTKLLTTPPRPVPYSANRTVTTLQVQLGPLDILNGAITELKLADLAVSTAKIQIAAVTSDVIAAQAVIAEKLGDGSVLAAKLADAAVETAKLADNAVVQGKIANAAVNSDKLANEAVIATKVADNAIISSKIANLAITELKIAADAVTNAKIATGAVLSAKLADNAVTVGKIADAAVSSAKIADAAIIAAKIGTAAITETKIADDAISTPKIQAGSITTAKLVVTNSGVVVHPDPYMRDRLLWENPSNSSGGGAYAYVPNNTSAYYESNILANGPVYNEYYNTKWPIDRNKDYLLTTRVRINAGSSTYYTGWVFFDRNGNRIDNVEMSGWPSANLPSGRYYAPAAVTPTFAYQTYSYVMGPNGQFQAPANAASMSFMFIANYLGVTGDITRIGEINVSEMSRGELIVDGSIIADKIAANAITTAKIAANAVTATQIAAGTITADKIATRTITADKIVSNSITVNELIVSNFENLYFDGSFIQGNLNAWISTTAGVVVEERGSSAGNAVQTAPTRWFARLDPGANREIVAARDIQVSPGEQFYMSADVAGSGGTPNGRCLLRVLWELKDGTTIFDTSANIQHNSSGWATYTFEKTAPNDAVKIQLLSFYKYNIAGTDSGVSYATNILMKRKNDANLIVDGAITANKLGANSVVAGKIAANAITTANLIVTGAKNAINPDAFFEDASIWNNPTRDAGAGTYLHVVNNSAAYATNYLYVLNGKEVNFDNTKWTIDRLKTYLLSTRVRRDAGGTGTFYTVWRFWDSNGNLISTTTPGWPSQNNSQGNYYAPSAINPPTSYGLYNFRMGPEGDFEAPAGAKSMSVGFIANYNQVSGTTRIGAFQVSEMATGELIVDGAITADKIAANAVVAGKIAANSVTATQIAAGTITATELASNSVITAKIAAGAVLAGNIGALAVTADKIAANAITADKIQAGAVTAAKITVGNLAAISAVLGNVDISSANIGSLIVGTSNLGFGSVTGTGEAGNTASRTTVGNTPYTTVATIAIPKIYGGLLQLVGRLTSNNGSSGTGSTTSRLRLVRQDNGAVFYETPVVISTLNAVNFDFDVFRLDQYQSAGPTNYLVQVTSDISTGSGKSVSWSVTNIALYWKA